MKLLLTISILVLSIQLYAGERNEGRGRGEGRGEGRGREHRNDSDINIFDISNSLLISSYIFEPCKEAAQVIFDAQDFIQSGTVSILLDEKIRNIKIVNQELSTEEAIDLVVANSELNLK